MECTMSKQGDNLEVPTDEKSSQGIRFYKSSFLSSSSSEFKLVSNPSEDYELDENENVEFVQNKHFGYSPTVFPDLITMRKDDVMKPVQANQRNNDEMEDSFTDFSICVDQRHPSNSNSLRIEILYSTIDDDLDENDEFENGNENDEFGNGNENDEFGSSSSSPSVVPGCHFSLPLEKICPNMSIQKMRPKDGICIIMNNSFKEEITSEDKTQLKLRNGTCYDVKELENKHLWLNLEVITYNDPPSILDILKKPPNQIYDICMVYILSHGFNGGVYDSNGKKVKFEEMPAAIISAGWPIVTSKLFFIQACQGDMNEKEASSSYFPVGQTSLTKNDDYLDDRSKSSIASFDFKSDDTTPKKMTNSSDIVPKPTHIIPSENSQNMSIQETIANDNDVCSILYLNDKEELLCTDSCPTNFKSTISFPENANFFFYHAAIPGTASYRRVNHGSLFIQTWCDVLEKYAEDMSLMQMIPITNCEVALQTHKINSNTVGKQMPTTGMNTMIKTVRFKPNGKFSEYFFGQ